LFIFLDGNIIETTSEFVRALAPGVLQTRGVFETMLAWIELYAGGKRLVLPAFMEHMDRMERGLMLMGINRPFDVAGLGDVIGLLLKKNHIGRARVRVSVWEQGGGIRSSVICQPFYGYSEKKYFIGFTAIISSELRKKTRFSHLKTYDYRCFYDAFQEAIGYGYDEAILLNSRGELVEGTRTNLFWIKKQTIFTPAIRCGCLNGITRQIVRKCVRSMGLSFHAVHADIHQLLDSDEAFFTNSLHGVMPLVRVGFNNIGEGYSGELSLSIREEYKKILSSLLTIIKI